MRPLVWVAVLSFIAGSLAFQIHLWSSLLDEANAKTA